MMMDDDDEHGLMLFEEKRRDIVRREAQLKASAWYQVTFHSANERIKKHALYLAFFALILCIIFDVCEILQ